MAKFKVTYNSGTEEEVEADSYHDVKTWVVFMIKNEDVYPSHQEVLRLKANGIKRIERL